MTSGAVRDAVPAETPAVVSVGRPPWWLLVVAVVVGSLVTADLLTGSLLERMDLRVAALVSDWDLQESAGYLPIWALTQVGGRGTILIVLAVLLGYLGWRRRTLLPVARVLLALVLLTVVVYGIKHAVGRTAPGFPGSYFFHEDGASFPSGHVANAVLMWGVARWLAVEYRLPARAQRACWLLSVVGPLITGLAMVSLNFHWVTDAVVGAAVGVLLLGVVHALDATVLSRYVRARAGRQTA